MKAKKKAKPKTPELVGTVTVFGERFTVWLMPRVRIDKNYSAEYIVDGEKCELNLLMSKSKKTLVIVAGSFVSHRWRSAHVKKARSWSDETAAGCIVGTERYTVKVTREATAKLFEVDHAARLIRIRNGSKAELIERTLRAVDEAWRTWRYRLVTAALEVRPSPDVERIAPADFEPYAADFYSAAAKIMGEVSRG